MLINRRKLIQLFLSELHGERQYLEFKVRADLDSERGRASIAKAICGLANGNRTSRSYIVFGIEDGTGAICGIDPIDDQRFQQLARNHLNPAPTILYENVVFPGLEGHVVGLLTVYPTAGEVRILRNIWKLKAGDKFQRIGSETLRESEGAAPALGLQEELVALEARSAASLEAIVRDVAQFHVDTYAVCRPRFLVFHDRHTLCYSGYPETDSIESEAWAVLAGEGVKLFWGALQYVEFGNTEDSFTVTERIPLFWREERILVPIEKTIFRFLPDGKYRQERQFVFKTPTVTRKEIGALLEAYRKDLATYRSAAYEAIGASPRFEIYCHELLVAALNGEITARQYLLDYLDGQVDGSVSEARTEAIRFLNRIEAA